jgi:hypothetical protein
MNSNVLRVFILSNISGILPFRLLFPKYNRRNLPSFAIACGMVPEIWLLSNRRSSVGAERKEIFGQSDSETVLYMVAPFKKVTYRAW